MMSLLVCWVISLEQVLTSDEGPKLKDESNHEIEFEVKDCVGLGNDPIELHKWSGEGAAKCTSAEPIFGPPKWVHSQVYIFESKS